MKGRVIAGLIVAALGLDPADASAQGFNPCSREARFALALHGGAVWGITPHPAKEAFLAEQLRLGRERLAQGARALDVIEDAIAAMEDSGLYNAGKGSTANRAGEVEMDAALMEGRLLRAGAVASVRRVRNPISAARVVMTATPHVLMVGPVADAFLVSKGAAEAEPAWFLHSGVSFPDLRLPERRPGGAVDPSLPRSLAGLAGVWGGVLEGRLNHVLVVGPMTAEGADVVLAIGGDADLEIEPATLEGRATYLNDFLIVVAEGFRATYRLDTSGRVSVRLTARNGEAAEGVLRLRPDLLDRGGTVGAVALDRCGDLAAGSSTGGFGSKLPGRVGDTPVPGAGIYADNRAAAVSSTGHGEFFLRHVVAHEIVARIRHGGETLQQAVRQVILDDLPAAGGDGGVIAVDRQGRVVTATNTDGMVSGWTTDRLLPRVGTYDP